jgi:predicted RNA polymerase sigma factor
MRAPKINGAFHFALRLARALAELMPDEPEVIGLLALLLLTDARRPARVGLRVSWWCSRSRTGRCGTWS